MIRFNVCNWIYNNLFECNFKNNYNFFYIKNYIDFNI